MPAQRVLLTDNVFASIDELHAELRPHDLVIEVAPRDDERTLAELAGTAVAIIVVYAKITEPVIAAAAAAGCRVISRCGIGYDNIDIASATRHGVQVTYVPDYCLDEVADHTIGLLLAFARGLVTGALTTRGGGWGVPREGIHRLKGRRLSLIGVGRIGRRVASRALSLGLEVTAYDPYIPDWDVDGVAQAHTLEAALGSADFVSLHAPLTPENHHLIAEGALAMMKSKPVLINTARGGLIDLAAVAEALDRGHLAGLALDVFEAEPLAANHPLRAHPRAVLTPHMAYYSAESETELKRRAAEEVVRAVSGQPPRCPVNQLEARRVG